MQPEDFGSKKSVDNPPKELKWMVVEADLNKSGVTWSSQFDTLKEERGGCFFLDPPTGLTGKSEQGWKDSKWSLD